MFSWSRSGPKEPEQGLLHRAPTTIKPGCGTLCCTKKQKWKCRDLSRALSRPRTITPTFMSRARNVQDSTELRKKLRETSCWTKRSGNLGTREDCALDLSGALRLHGEPGGLTSRCPCSRSRTSLTALLYCWADDVTRCSRCTQTGRSRPPLIYKRAR